jgi:endonuclease/exonuclease/phosphatase family metal-dependent hydrolase
MMRRWWAPALVACLVLVYALVGERLRGGLGLPGSGAAPTKGAGLRVATWNLRNFPEPTQDLARLRERLKDLGADLLAVQEIHDPVALQALLPGWAVHLSEQGGRGHQRLGVAFDPAVLELVEPVREHLELAMGGRVRPGLSAYLRARDGGPDFHVLVIHLKAKPDGQPLRMKQWSLLAAIAGDLLRRDPDLIVLGDFNATGAVKGSADQELAALGAVLEPLGLRRLAPDSPCSAYWEGSRRDAWHEPSLLDLVWVAALEEGVGPASRVRPLHHCARHQCRPFRSTPAHPEPDYANLSDHCPVMLDLAPGGDDDP